VPIYREYLLKGEALYDVFILLVCLNVLHIADGEKTSGWSLITYLSYPPGNSVNDFIDEKLTTVQYSKFDNVICIIQTLGEHVKIGNIHIKSAFRRFLYCPGDFNLLGF
jgi:hypothetical protein